MVPGLAPEKMSDEAAAKAYSEKAKANPNAFIVYQPVGRDGMDMGPQLAMQAATDILSALLVAWVLSLGAPWLRQARRCRRGRWACFLADRERALVELVPLHHRLHGRQPAGAGSGLAAGRRSPSPGGWVAAIARFNC
jgi:hypothetical protein